MNGITYLSVGTMKRCHTYLPAEIVSWRTVFPPVKTTGKNIPAKSAVIRFIG